MGDTLPEAVCELLDGRDPAGRMGVTVLLLTTSDEGWPQVAMLSVGEVLAVDRRHLRLALWPGSGSTGNLARGRLATLMLVLAPDTYYVRLRARQLADLSLSSGVRACFEGDVEDVLRDVVGYATVTSGIEFRLDEPERVLPVWREALAALAAATS